ncbi:MAG: zinc-dependent alcohol dehydrogenase family protein [Planctomycetota bacterium]|nr:zinc-dependent alcohol dehydrogenase family protein [Planctomycetota bacterium]
MKAAKIIEKGRVDIVDLPKPEPGDGEVLIRVESSGICGTDLHMYHGQSMGGYPIVPGHEFAGVVEAAGRGTSRFKAGDRVAVEPNLSCGNCPACLENRQHFCRNWQALGVTLPGGMAEYAVAPENAAFGIGDLDSDSGSFVEPLSCVLHGLERLGPRIGDRSLLLGTGPIGLLLMRVLKCAGASGIDVIETDAGRREMAAKEGMGAAFSSFDGVEKRRYDAVIDATGVLAAERDALDFVRDCGTVLYFGVPPEGGTFALEPYQLFRRELTLLSTFTSLRNSLQAVRLMREGAVKVSDLVSHRLPLEDLEKAFTMLIEKREPALKVVMKP